MAGSAKQRLVTEKRGFRAKPLKHPRYRYVVYRIEEGRRVEQTYFQSERAANAHAYTENIRLKNEGVEGQILGPELRGQAIEASRRRAPYGKSLRDAIDFYEVHLKSEASLRQTKLAPFVGEFLKAKEEGKTSNAQVLSPEAFSKLIKSAAEEALRPVLALQAFAGLRRAEVEQIEWDEIKFDTGRIIPTRTKSGKWRYIIMRPNLRAWLERVPKDQRSGTVCKVRYREALDRARPAAELMEWPHNCLRHSFSSYSLVAEENETRLQMELGHSTPRLLVEHYRAIVSPADARAWWSVMPG